MLYQPQSLLVKEQVLQEGKLGVGHKLGDGNIGQGRAGVDELLVDVGVEGDNLLVSINL